MGRGDRIELAAELLGMVEAGSKPLDYLAASFFRTHKRLGEDDRRFVVEAVYGLLRRERYYRELAGADPRLPASLRREARLSLFLLDERLAGRREVLSALSERAGVPLRDAERIAAAAAAAAGLEFLEPEVERFAALHAFPTWVVEALEPSLGRAELAALLDGLNEPAPLALRANTFVASAGELADALAREGVATRPGRLSPHALIVERPTNLFRTGSFGRGLFEVQDEGSQVVSLLLNPKPGAKVFDACAGAGGKTLHLAALMRGRGEVFAYDTDPRRLANIHRRLARSGLQNVRVLESGERVARWLERAAGAVDLVLVDAPCSGLGTVRRNPDIKLHATPELVAAMNRKQLEILDAYAGAVRPGGRLLYATCSILPSENEAVVERFLAAHPGFALLPVGRAVEEVRVDGDLAPLREALSGRELLRLTPHEHGTDGFFAALFSREPAG